VVNEPPAERARALVERADTAVVVLDAERRLVAASAPAAAVLGGTEPGRPLGEELLAAHPELLALFLDSAPELSAYEELRAGFTAAVSHELRTPLARVLALLESAALPGADAETLLEQAQAEVQEARELIDEVLFLGELETGREVVALGRTEAAPVVDDVLAAFAPRAERAGVELAARVSPGLAVPLRPRMLRVVVENLVGNAIRHAGEGARCTVSATDLGSGPVLTVADDGRGVGRGELERLFERFYRADQARSTRGTGLGLAIVKHVVTAAGGSVDARGAPGKGLEIVARFPA
jgi:signal transduction histidine kinase